ncbi:MAG: germination protein YpeB [Clostridia bacterium]|nr:germination protein YpeB [Clostridia bacterium]
MKKRKAVRIASFALALLVVLGVLAANGAQAAQGYRQQLEYTYQRAMNELTEELQTMETALKKSAYAAGSEMMERLAMELATSSAAAKAAIEALPFSDNRMERVTRFLSQVGDYALALSSKLAAGEELSDEENDNLGTMAQYAGQLRDTFEQAQTTLHQNRVHIGEAEAAISNLVSQTELPSFDDGLDELAETFSAYPELLYDGPFSDHVNQKEAAFIQGKAEVNNAEALDVAARHMGYQRQYITQTGITENTLPTYNFACVDKTVRVAVNGGELVSYEHNMTPQDTLLFVEEALQKAEDYLRGLGMEQMQESYYVVGGNTCTVNYAWVEDGVVCYPDLVKVTVSMETGEILGYNATGYFMNHTERTIPSPKITKEEAAEKVSDRLQVRKTQLAIIPSPGLYERLCYEFTCKAEDGQEVLVYVNAETGVTEQIYLVLKSDGGVLAQ